jgi:putative ABC transport system permease protein
LPHEFHGDRWYELESETRAEGRPALNTSEATVDVDYFKALGQPILAGRGFDARDLGQERSTVLVNTMFVERMFGGRNPLGHRIRLRAGDGEQAGPWLEIIGVVPRLGMNDAGKDDDQGLYYPGAPGEIYPLQLAIHVTGDPNTFAARLRELVIAVDPNAGVVDARPLSEVEDDNAAGMAKTGLAAGLLTLVLLGLAASGVYAILSLAVSLRTREIGIRTALGAQRNRIILQIARRSLLQIGAGVVIGTPLSYMMLRSFKENRGWDMLGSPLLLALLIGLGLMATVGALGCTVPLRRALRIMPTEALREG